MIRSIFLIALAVLSASSFAAISNRDKAELGGSKTFITNGGFESGVAGWSLCRVTLSGGVPTGSITSGASSFTTFQGTTSSPLAGSESLLISSTGATTAGHGFCSNTFTIDAQYSTASPKPQTIRGAYSVVSGLSNMNFSGTSSNTWAVYIYDVTNSAWIQPAGVYNFIGNGEVTATFQPAITSSQYQLVVLNVNATAGAISMKFDEFLVGPQAVQKGPAMGDDTATTLTPSAGFGTTSLQSSWVSRWADKATFHGYFKTGTVAAVAASIALPSGYVIDLNKKGSVSQAQMVGWYQTILTGTNANMAVTSRGPIFYDGSDTGNVYFANQSGANVYKKNNGNDIFNNSDGVSFEFTVPIAGWSSNSVQSSDTDTRVVSGIFGGTPSASYTANNPIIFPTVTKDTHGGYNASTGRYTVPVSGFYDITTLVYGNYVIDSRAYLYVDGVQQTPELGIAVVANRPINGSTQIYLNAGQVVDIRANNNWSASNPMSFTISRRSGPAVVTATETVAASYYNTNGQSVSSGSATTITNWTKENDSHSLFNASTGVGTMPVSGRYTIDAQLSGAASASGAIFQVYIRKNGSVVRKCGINSPAGNGNTLWPVMCRLSNYSFNQGDTFDVQYFQNTGSSVSMYSSDSTINFVSVARVGN